MDYFMVIIRSLASLTVLFIVTKLIGKKQVSELSLFDYVIGISIGNFAAEMILNTEVNFASGIIAVAVFGLISYIVSIITMKSIMLRKVFMGTPTMIIQNGKILKNNLKKVKIDINDLLEQCRSNGYFDISEIEYAVMEVNGKLSILPKSEYKPVNNKDMKIKTEKSSLCANVIIDGKVMKNNLKNMNKDINWLEKELRVRGVKIEDVLLSTLDCNEKLIFYLKNENIIPFQVLE